MNTMPDIGSVPAPTHSKSELLAYETECRDALRPLLESLLGMAEAAGWNRRTAASTLMFLAAQHLSAASKTSASGAGPAADRPTASTDHQQGNTT
ncbi:hypothetical protein KEU06_27560 [Pseudaminobacter sp. 19-2017]|uniref:Uncharacterized protein n=1 Tax=Pseudaminobacter soli (ex Zhang et al. 2022) TaxID=2831468 RepID=A0A942I522_9HYPH|nr:hypothetical protein [Pseudaminobacter soli]MBS3652354.1 hypothetical protein [Pseudaminobacter soli]